jgi:CheY-like chemotaxis protein
MGEARDSEYQRAVWSFHHRLANRMTASLETMMRLGRVPDLPASARALLEDLQRQMDAMVEEIQEFQHQQEQRPAEGPTKRRRVLLVDDEVILLKLESEVLGKDYQVETAQTVEQAVQLLLERSYEAILLDVSMGGDHGGRSIYEMLQETRPELTERVLFVSGGVVDPDLMDFLQRSGRPVLDKPFTMGALREVIARIAG